MPNQVVWNLCNVYDPDGNATTLKRGELVPDGVDTGQVETLMVIGAVKPVDVVPDTSETPSEDDAEPAPELLQKPSPEDSKAAWEAYASDERNPSRLPASQAKSMSKQALMDRFK